MDEGLKASDDPVVPEEDNLNDAADVQPEETGGSDSQAGQPEGENTTRIPEMPEAQVTERLDEPMPELPRPGEETIPPAR